MISSTWCTDELDERGSSSKAASGVSSATWKPATPEVPELALARSLITNPNCLCFESMQCINGAQIKMKKETQGTTPFSNVLKLLFWEFFHFAKQISSGF